MNPQDITLLGKLKEMSQFTEVTRDLGWSIVYNGNRPQQTTTQASTPLNRESVKIVEGFK